MVWIQIDLLLLKVNCEVQHNAQRLIDKILNSNIAWIEDEWEEFRLRSLCSALSTRHTSDHLCQCIERFFEAVCRIYEVSHFRAEMQSLGGEIQSLGYAYIAKRNAAMREIQALLLTGEIGLNREMRGKFPLWDQLYEVPFRYSTAEMYDLLIRARTKTHLHFTPPLPLTNLPPKDLIEVRDSLIHGKGLFLRGKGYVEKLTIFALFGGELSIVDCAGSRETYRRNLVEFSAEERFGFSKTAASFLGNNHEIIIQPGVSDLGRMVNHSHEPNSELVVVVVDGLLALAFISIKDLIAGDEITIDYGWSVPVLKTSVLQSYVREAAYFEHLRSPTMDEKRCWEEGTRQIERAFPSPPTNYWCIQCNCGSNHCRRNIVELIYCMNAEEFRRRASVPKKKPAWPRSAIKWI